MFRPGEEELDIVEACFLGKREALGEGFMENERAGGCFRDL